MMKKIIALCVALLSATLLPAKPYTQQGIAYLYDYKTKTKNPVANVSLTVAYAKGPAISRTDGTFTIEFQDFGAGKKLALEKQPFSQGLMVLNKKEVDEWYTIEGKLTLIMCNKKDFDVCKQNYYDVGLQSVTQRYKRKIAALKQESADYQQRLQELEEEHDRIMDNLRNSADAMARIDQSELDAAMQKVLDLYEQGNVEEAMKKLEDMKLEEKFVQTLERKQQHEADDAKDSVQILNKLRTSVDMYKNNGSWDKAAETLKLLADKLNTFDDVFAYANFCYNQNDFKDAEIYYKKALEICQLLAKENPKAYEPYVAGILNDLGNLNYNTQRFTEAEEMYKQALEIRQRMAKDNPKAYEPNVASTLNNLASLYRNTQRFADAEAMYKEALEIQRCLAQAYPQAYESDVATTLNNLAILYANTQRYADAEAMYKEALEIRRCLAQVNPQVYEKDVTWTLNNLANLYRITQRFTESEAMLIEALEINRRLAQKNPQVYEPDLSGTLNNLANLYNDAQQFNESEKLHKEALEICRRLAKANPQAYEPDVATTLCNMGSIYFYNGRFNECETKYKEALEIYQRLTTVNPLVYEPYVALTLTNLASLYSYTHNFIESVAMHIEALEVWRRLATTNPKTYEPSMATALNNLAFLYSNIQRYADAEMMYKEALEILRRLVQANQQAFEPDVAHTLYNLASLYKDSNRFNESILMYKEALGLYRRLAKINSTLQQRYIASLYWLSRLYARTDNQPASYQTNQELLPLLKTKYGEDADAWRNNYSMVLSVQSEYSIDTKNYSQAELLAREGLSVDSTKHWIAGQLAAALLFQGKYAEAEKIYRQYKDELKDDFLDDFEQFKAAGVIPKEREEDVEKIKRMLEE